jgi:FkbM family methyltransferase
MSAAEFIYATLLKQRFLRAVANGIILGVLPRAVRVGEATVVINPRDPVVSGALAFRVYEKSEIAFIRRVCKPGLTMLDIGANVGLYTALAGTQIGPLGKVIAFEPDPESFALLQQTAAANNLVNVQLVQAAASNSDGSALLFTSSENRGDNRLYHFEMTDGSVLVRTVKLDDYLEDSGISSVDLIKIDVQGYEGIALEGLERTISRSNNLRMLMEFWPDGLRRAGTDPLILLRRLSDLGLKIHQLGRRGDFFAISDWSTLIKRHPGRKYTNLVLVGASASLG